MPGRLPALLTHKWRQIQIQTCTVTTCLCLPSGSVLPFPPISMPHWLQPDGPEEAQQSWIIWFSCFHLFYTPVQGRTLRHERGWQSTTLCKNLSWMSAWNEKGGPKQCSICTRGGVGCCLGNGKTWYCGSGLSGSHRALLWGRKGGWSLLACTSGCCNSRCKVSKWEMQPCPCCSGRDGRAARCLPWVAVQMTQQRKKETRCLWNRPLPLLHPICAPCLSNNIQNHRKIWTPHSL